MDAVVAVIPARQWSQGVIGKNRGPGLALLESWFLSWATRIPLILTTDDPVLAAEASSLGAFVRWRPDALCDGPMGPVIADAIAHTDAVDAQVYVVLQPSSPTERRWRYALGAAHQLRERAEATSVVSVVPWAYEPPQKAVTINADGYLTIPDAPSRRQDCPPAYRRDGTVYAVRPEYAKQGDLYGPRPLPLLVTPSDSVTID